MSNNEQDYAERMMELGEDVHALQVRFEMLMIKIEGLSGRLPGGPERIERVLGGMAAIRMETMTMTMLQGPAK